MVFSDEARSGKESLRQQIADLVAPMQLNAIALDREADFPIADVQALRDIGCLSAPLPINRGGLGLGTSSNDSIPLAQILRLLGRGNLAVARIFEAHVNALRLIALYGSDALQEKSAKDALTGHLFGLWVTDGAFPLRIVGKPETAHLSGGKAFCSAAGYATRAVVTAMAGENVHLLYVEAPYKPASSERHFPPQGMRATATGPIDLEGVPVSTASFIGLPGNSTFRSRNFLLALGGPAPRYWAASMPLLPKPVDNWSCAIAMIIRISSHAWDTL